MKRSPIFNSGGHHFDYPKWVWSPAGGWWANPTNWRRNTALYGVFVVVTCVWASVICEPKTVIKAVNIILPQ